MSDQKRGPGRPATGQRPRVSFVLNAADRAELDQVAAAEGELISTIIRRALRAYLESAKEKKSS